MAALIITLRLVVGAVFVMSGFVKMIDLYGFIFKIEEYLAVWQWDIPRSVTLLGAMILCATEFCGGAVLMTGMLRRVAVWGLTLLTAGMTVLTAWIYMADPVSDCGCFGDFVTLSNGATFLKNLVLMAALLFLCRTNTRVSAQLLHPAIQWLGITLITLYIAIIGLYGYNIEPMLDFRPFPVGSELVADSGSDDDEPELQYIYEKDGRQQTFSIDSLPDSTWTYVDAVESPDSELDRREVSALTIYDADGDDITAEVLTGEGQQLLLIVPEPVRMDISYTFQLNELEQWASRNGVAMTALLATNEQGIERWRDLSMAAYECYSVEDTKLKELSRGIMSLVYVSDGHIVFKRNLSSITSADFDTVTMDGEPIETLAPDSHTLLVRMSIALVALLIVIHTLQDAIIRITHSIRNYDKRMRQKEKKQ